MGDAPDWTSGSRSKVCGRLQACEATTRRPFTCRSVAREGFYSSSPQFSLCQLITELSQDTLQVRHEKKKKKSERPRETGPRAKPHMRKPLATVAVLFLIIATPVWLYLLFPFSSCPPQNVQPDPLLFSYSWDFSFFFLLPGLAT